MTTFDRILYLPIKTSLSVLIGAEEVQIAALESLIRRYTDTASATITKGGFDLPDSYLGFELSNSLGFTILTGGIDEEGTIST